MAVIPINVARVSNNLRSFHLLQTTRQTQLGLFRSENQLATGLRFQAASDDPIGASRAGLLERRVDQLGQLQKNLQSANSALTSIEAAMQESIDLLREARQLSLESIGDTISSEERQSLAIAVERIIDQLIAVGNREHLGLFLFSGHEGAKPPFELVDSGVLYNGDAGRMEAITDTDFSQDSFTVPGIDFFAAVSGPVRGIADLDPRITTSTLVSELRGTSGNGISLGSIVVTDGATQAVIDLSAATTVGDVLDALNAGLPPTLRAFMDTAGIAIVSTGLATVQIMVDDVGGGSAARDLGLHTNGAVGPRAAADLDPRLTARTRLSDLNANVLGSLSAGLTVRNGARATTLSFNGAQTVEDVLNIFNHSSAGVWARIADDGRTIEVRNRISGSDLRIEEAGGGLATALGIRSMDGDTTLTELNDGRGVSTLPGNDIRITTRSGAQIDIDVDGAATLQDLIDRFNLAGGGAISVNLNQNGNGLVIRDNTVGAGTLTASRLQLSPALSDLGLDVVATGNQLIGRDVNPIRVDGPFTALLELRESLRGNDTRGLQIAGERIERVMDRMQEVQGQTAAQARKLDERAQRMESEVSATRIMLSDVRDVDFAEAIVKFQQLQTALQANYATASQVLNLSLLDFLR